MKLCGAQKSSSVHCVFLECNNADTTRQSHKADKNVLPEVATTWIKKIKKEKKHKYTGYKLRFPKLAELTPLEPFRFRFFVVLFSPTKKTPEVSNFPFAFWCRPGVAKTDSTAGVSQLTSRFSYGRPPLWSDVYTAHTVKCMQEFLGGLLHAA